MKFTSTKDLNLCYLKVRFFHTAVDYTSCPYFSPESSSSRGKDIVKAG